MLPDLPNLKSEIQKILDLYLAKQINIRLGFIGESPKQIIHEGNRTRVIREDGSVEETELQMASAEITLNIDDIPFFTPEKRLSMINETADKMAKNMSTMLLESLQGTLEKAGRVIDQKGKPLDADAIFSLFEFTQIDFDRAGMHVPFSLVLSPELFEKAAQTLERIKSDPKLRERYEEIMLKKRMEWLDREAARKLVG